MRDNKKYFINRAKRDSTALTEVLIQMEMAIQLHEEEKLTEEELSNYLDRQVKSVEDLTEYVNHYVSGAMEVEVDG